jgi:23S rRNA (guanosine2251-2'-O)-methyltransferase
LTAIAGFDGHQGVALVVEPRRFATLDDVLARAAERGEPPFVLVLDSLEDPQNVGTLLRSAEAAGVHGIIFPTRRQAPLSPAAVKASAGAVEHLLLCPVDDLAGALADLHARGLRIAGSEADAPLTARQTDLRGPLAIVVGSEGQGLGPAVRKRCDLFMRIPMRGSIGSLNAAVAGSVLLFEAVAQRDPDGRPSPSVVRGTMEPRAVDETSAADDAPTATGTIDPGTESASTASLPGTVASPTPKTLKPAKSPRIAKSATPVPTPVATPDPMLETPAHAEKPRKVAPARTPSTDLPEAAAALEHEGDADLLPGGPAPATTPKSRKPRAPRSPHA